VTTIMITNSVEEALLLSDRIVPILPGPPATLGVPIHVDLPRGRTVAQLVHDEQASHVRAHVVATLTAALGSRRPRAGVVLTEKENTKPGVVSEEPHPVSLS
jgi:nitrate/nitrite transport system ATP-binding protein